MTKPMEEGYVSVPGDRVWYKVVGINDEIPLLVLHRGPGYPRLSSIEDPDILGCPP